MNYAKVKRVTSLDVIKKLGSEMYQDLIKTTQTHPPDRWFYNWTPNGGWYMIRQTTKTLALDHPITCIRDKGIYILSSLESIQEVNETWPRLFPHWTAWNREFGISAGRLGTYIDPIGDLVLKPETIDPDPLTVKAVNQTWGPDKFEELKNRINEEYNKARHDKGDRNRKA